MMEFKGATVVKKTFTMKSLHAIQSPKKCKTIFERVFV